MIRLRRLLELYITMASCSKNAISSAFSFHNADKNLGPNLVEMVEPCLLFVEVSSPEPGSNDVDPDTVFCEVTDSAGISRDFDFEGDDRWKFATHEVESGSTTLFAPGITLDLQKRRIYVPADAVPDFGTGVSLFQEAYDDGEDLYSGRNAKNANGTLEVLLVAIVGTGPKDHLVDTYANISDQLFGILGDTTNLAAQMSACSYQRLNYIPSTNPHATDGIIEINLGRTLIQTVNNTNYIESRYEAEAILRELIGELPGSHRHIIYAFPKGMAGWTAAANAAGGGWRSQFNTPYYVRLGTLMHELGHNLGFSHSWKGDSISGYEYGDGTGYMGKSGCQPNPMNTQQCYNGMKSWMVDWYMDRQLSIHPLEDPVWQEDLVGVVDYQKDGPLVTLRILGNSTHHYFVSYNRKVGINQDVCEQGEEVIIHYRTPNDNSRASYKVGHLKEGESFVDKNWDPERPLNIVFDSLDSSTAVWKPNVKVFATCHSDADCDNGEPCDGEETCGEDGECIPGTPIFCAEPSAAPTQFCLDSSLLSLEQSGGKMQNTNVGNVFDFDARTDMYLRSMKLKVKTQKAHIITVYAKEGSYVGKEGEESAWTTIADAVPLAVGVKTVDVSPYFVNGGTTHALYVHVAAVDDGNVYLYGGLNMNKAGPDDAFLDVIAFDDHLSIKWGLKIKNAPFSEVASVANIPYAMVGTMYYNVCGEKPSMSPSLSMIPSKSNVPTESKRPSTNPSISSHPSESFLPSMSPSHFCQVNPILELILDSGARKGVSHPISIVFDIDALKGIYIETLFLNIKEGKEHVVTVYTKQGTYVGFEGDDSAWTPIVDGVTMTQGLIPSDSFLSFFVDEGSTQAFFVHVETSVLVGGKFYVENGGTAVDFGGVSTTNEDISFKYGKKMDGSFGGKEATTPYALKGKFYYRTCEDAVTSAPTTAAPTPVAPATAAPTTTATAPATGAPTTTAPTTAAPTTAAPTTAAPTTAAPTLPVPITLAPTKGKSKREKIKECKQKVAAIYSKQVKALKKSKAKGVATCKRRFTKKQDQAKKKNCIQGQSNKYKKGLKAKKSVKVRDSKKCNTAFN